MQGGVCVGFVGGWRGGCEVCGEVRGLRVDCVGFVGGVFVGVVCGWIMSVEGLHGRWVPHPPLCMAHSHPYNSSFQQQDIRALIARCWQRSPAACEVLPESQGLHVVHGAGLVCWHVPSVRTKPALVATQGSWHCRQKLCAIGLGSLLPRYSLVIIMPFIIKLYFSTA